jgi:tRNA(Arg) A34 adenosine deaminase TadA
MHYAELIQSHDTGSGLSLRSPNDHEIRMISHIHEMGKEIRQLVQLAAPWANLAKNADYYAAIERLQDDDAPFFEILVTSSVLFDIIQDTRLPLRLFCDAFANGEEICPNNQLNRNAIAAQKNNTDGIDNPQNIPSPLELHLYKRIAHGADPWQWIQKFPEILKTSIRKNPAATSAIIETIGLDLLLPNFPPITTIQRTALQRTLNQWYSDTIGQVDGIDFFCQALRVTGISTQRIDEPADDYVSRIVRCIPSLEEYTPNTPEYVMQLCLGIAYPLLHRRIRYKEMYEGVAALVIKNNKIIGAACNEPTENPEIFIHAEDIAIAKAVKATDDPTLSNTTLVCLLGPCDNCVQIINRYNISRYIFGPRTVMGRGHALDTSNRNVQYNILSSKIQTFFELDHGWNNFLLPE